LFGSNAEVHTAAVVDSFTWQGTGGLNWVSIPEQLTFWDNIRFKKKSKKRVKPKTGTGPIYGPANPHRKKKKNKQDKHSQAQHARKLQQGGQKKVQSGRYTPNNRSWFLFDLSELFEEEE